MISLGILNYVTLRQNKLHTTEVEGPESLQHYSQLNFFAFESVLEMLPVKCGKKNPAVNSDVVVAKAFVNGRQSTRGGSSCCRILRQTFLTLCMTYMFATVSRIYLPQT